MEIEVNNFGISAINPIVKGKPTYAKPVLAGFLHSSLNGVPLPTDFNLALQVYLAKFGAIPDISDPSAFTEEWLEILKKVEEIPYKGETSTEPLETGTLQREAHMYLTELQHRVSQMRNQGQGLADMVYEKFEFLFIKLCFPRETFLYNGFIKGNPHSCFYDTLEPEGDIIKVWTEDTKIPPGVIDYAKYWRIQDHSKELNEEFFRASVPVDTNVTPMPTVELKVALLATNPYIRERSCNSYCLGAYPDRYSDLAELGITPFYSEALERICYCHARSQLYPLTGALLGKSSRIIGSSIFARRGIELAGLLSHNHQEAHRNHCSGDDHVNKFTRLVELEEEEEENPPPTPEPPEPPQPERRFQESTHREHGEREPPEFKEVDKLQRIYPGKSRCFRMTEVDYWDHDLFPPDIIEPDQNGSIRYVYWNKRTACACPFRGAISSPEKCRGPDFWSHPKFLTNLDQGWGCQIYPFFNLDGGRGNLEEDRIADFIEDFLGLGLPPGLELPGIPEGAPNDPASLLAAVLPACVYPFIGGSVCEVKKTFVPDFISDIMSASIISRELCGDNDFPFCPLLSDLGIDPPCWLTQFTGDPCGSPGDSGDDDGGVDGTEEG